MRKRIVFLTMWADTQYTLDLIRVIGKQAAVFDYDLYVITHFINYYNDDRQIIGEENIYSLLRQMHFDGAILAGGSYYHTELADSIAETLGKLGVPAIMLDCVKEGFPSVIQDSREHFCMLTEHFITEHGFDDIVCLTGPEGEHHAEQRLSGYRDALEKHGIPFDREKVFYGDFWIGSGIKLAEDIISGRIKKPQAVVCGNDYMALQLCWSLMEAGVRIPEEIAVGGYDGNPDLMHFHPLLTTVCGTYLQTGAEAVCRLHTMISGETAVPVKADTTLQIGASCGCDPDQVKSSVMTRKHFMELQHNSVFLHSAYSSMMSSVSSLNECVIAIVSNLYLLEADDSFRICLCTDWQGDVNDPESYRKEGYSDKLTCILSRNSEGRIETGSSVSLSETEDTAVPSTCFITPLHYQDRAFGICMRRFSSEKAAFELYYGEFCQIIANAVERLRMNHVERELRLLARQNADIRQPYQAILKSLREKMYEEPENEWKAAEQASEIGISLSHFQHLYQEFHEVSFHADLMEARMSLAMSLLRNTTLSVSEIAGRCGYADISYFMRAFRKRTGKSALAYRRSFVK